ncbi:MAG: FG-GAP-like repeat-containing protein [Phormidesmis sp. CAN_BIN36]|nr:FG-GAP-like repeat-containing protein [Phormidesmis sp. CAN_BIN36]
MVWRNKLDGGFSVVQTDGKVVESSNPIKLGATPQSLSTDWKSQFGDLNGDGEDDILLRNQKDGTLAYWIMQGGTLLQYDLSPYKVPASWQSTLADFNNDDRADIFWRNKQTGQTAIWITNSTGLGFSSTAFLPEVPSSWDPTLGDFNGKDGKKDILWRNGQTGEVAIWLMNGTQIAAGGFAVLPNVAVSWKPQVGDFNKDGKSDVFWRNIQTGEVAIWLMNGNQIAPDGAVALQNVPIEWTAQVGDFDGNKADDFLWRNNQTGRIAVWLLDGTKIADSGVLPSLYTLPSRFNIERLADFNNDGKADLFLRDSASGEVAVWRMNGTSVLDANFLTQRSPNDQFDGIQQRRFKSTPQSIGGKTELSAFDIGTLNTAGVYADSISVDAPDFFKFKLAFKSDLVLSTSGLAVSLQLYKAGANGSASTLVSDYATRTLDPGVYYIKVSSGSSGGNYLLNVEGRPQFTELVGNAFTAPPTVLLTQGATDTDNPVSTVSIDYSIKNTGTFNAPDVNVSFYISKDRVFDSADRKVGGQIFNLQANQTQANTSLALNLPAWKDEFWTVDGDYFLLEVIDPSNTIGETNEDNNLTVLTLGVEGIPTTNLRGKSLTVDRIRFTPAEFVSATFVTENNGFKRAGTAFETRFYLSKDPVFDSTNLSPYWVLSPRSFINDIAGKSASAPQTTSLKLPSKDEWSVWKNLSGPQKFYIGMIQNTDGAVKEVDLSDNQNRGLGIDYIEITVNL